MYSFGAPKNLNFDLESSRAHFNAYKQLIQQELYKNQRKYDKRLINVTHLFTI